MNSLKIEITIAALLSLAVFTPIFSGYVLGVSMLILAACSRLPKNHDGLGLFHLATKPIGRGFRDLWFCLMLAALGSAMVSDMIDWHRWKSAMGNFAVKYILLWWALNLFWARGILRHKILRVFSVSLAGTSIVHFIYCVIQRKYGVDWAHGFAGRLGENRFAYDVYRVSGFMGHPLTLGYCQALMLVATAGLAMRETRRWAKMSWSMTALMSALVLLISGSRGPLLVGVLCSAGLLHGWLRKEHGKTFMLVVLCALGVFVASGGGNRFVELLSASRGGDARSVHWQVFFTIFREHWVFGIGPGASKAAISAYYKSLGADDNIILAHNTFLQFAADFGVIGLAGVMLLLGRCFMAVAAMTRFRTVLMMLMGVVVLGGMTQNNLQDSQFVFAFFMWALVIAVTEVECGNEQPRRYQNDDFLAGKGGENSDASGR